MVFCFCLSREEKFYRTLKENEKGRRALLPNAKTEKHQNQKPLIFFSHRIETANHGDLGDRIATHARSFEDIGSTTVVIIFEK